MRAGASDLGGLSANGDHISPEHPFPSVHQVRTEPAGGRLRADRAPVRVSRSTSIRSGCPGRSWTRSARATGASSRAAARGAPSRPPRSAATSCRARSSAPATGTALAPEELTALFAETRPEAIEDIRQAADELRAELAGDTVTFVVNRNINVSNVCTVGCAFCGFGQGKRSPDAYEHDEQEFLRRVARGGRVRRQRDLHPVGHPPGLDARGLPALAAGRQAGGATAAPPRLQPDGDRPHVRHLGAAARRGVRAPARGRPGVHARDGRRGAPRRRARTDLAQQAAGRPAGWR